MTYTFRCSFRFALDSLEEASSEGQVVAMPAAGDPIKHTKSSEIQFQILGYKNMKFSC